MPDYSDVYSCENELGMAVPCSDADIGESFWNMLNSWENMSTGYSGTGAGAGGNVMDMFDQWNWWQTMLYPYFSQEGGGSTWIEGGNPGETPGGGYFSGEVLEDLGSQYWSGSGIDPGGVYTGYDITEEEGYDFGSWFNPPDYSDPSTGLLGGWTDPGSMGSMYSLSEDYWMDPTLSFLAQYGNMFGNLTMDQNTMRRIGLTTDARISSLKEDYFKNLHEGRSRSGLSGFSGKGSGRNSLNQDLLDEFSSTVQGFYAQEELEMNNMFSQFGSSFMDILSQIALASGDSDPFMSDYYSDASQFEGEGWGAGGFQTWWEFEENQIMGEYHDQYYGTTEMGFYQGEQEYTAEQLEDCLSSASSPMEWAACYYDAGAEGDIDAGGG